MKKPNPYLEPGRLPDVIAAIQVMAAAERPEREIKAWAKELDRDTSDSAIARWTSVFKDHREFFLTYRLETPVEEKAALRWRYVFKTLDSKTGKEYTPAEAEALPEKERWLLTTRPLDGDQIETLLNTAIGLHTRALEQQSAKKWWIPSIAAVLGFAGAILGNLLSAAFGLHR